LTGWGRADRIGASFFGLVAQLVEQWTENPRVGGSIPSQATNPLMDEDTARSLAREVIGPCGLLDHLVGRGGDPLDLASRSTALRDKPA
jgi:hypothetical protein